MGINWIFNNEDFLEEKIGENYGFVYLITNTVTGRKYVGKKFFYSIKSKVVKGKRKRQKVPSDWQTYYGSNTELQNDVKIQGKETFLREIIHLCKTKGECSYLEAKEQFDKNVLLSEEYYNSWIMVRVRKTHLKDLNERLHDSNKGSQI